MSAPIGDDLMRLLLDPGDRTRAPSDLLARSLAQTAAARQRRPAEARLRLWLAGIDAAAPSARAALGSKAALVLVAVLLAVLGIVVAGAILGHRPSGGTIYWTTWRNSSTDPAAAPEDGTLHVVDATSLVSHGPGVRIDACPVGSPDGRRLAWATGTTAGATSGFAGAVTGPVGLVVADADGRNARAIAPAGGDIQWRGNESVLVTRMDAAGRPSFEALPVDGGAAAHLDRLAGVVSANPSPDGSRLAVILPDPAREPGTSFVLALAAPDGSAQVPLIRISGSTDGFQPYGVLWSPDGAHIAYLAVPDGSPGPRPELFVVDVATGRVHRITTNDASESDIRWSPDGRRLLFRTGFTPRPVWVADTGTWTASQVALDLGNPGVRSSHIAAEAERIDWSPDGRSLLVNVQAGLGSEVPALVVVPLDGGPTRTVTVVDTPGMFIDCAGWQAAAP